MSRVRAAVIAGGVAVVAAASAASYFYARPAETPDQARYRQSLGAVEELRGRLRHPDDLKVDAVFASADGSTVCIIYHAPSMDKWNDPLAAVKMRGKLDAGPDTYFRNTNCDPKVLTFKMDAVVAAANGPLKSAP